MRWVFAIALGLVLVAPALTGCLGFGGEDTASDGLETKSRAEVSSETGGIEGVVTDEAVQAIENANVTIVELGKETGTAEDGSFAFSNLQPGSYTVRVEAGGFIPTERTVDVSPGEVSTVEVVLAHEPTVSPYSQQFEFKGFLECSVGAGGAAVAVCAIPNFVLGGNATNDRFIFYHGIEANPWQMVTEMRWDANQPLSERLVLIVEPQGISNDNSVTFAEAPGTSPLVLNTDRQRFVDVIGNATAICEGEEDPPPGTSRDTYCNRRYIQDGGRLQLRVFVTGLETAGVTTVGAAIQQPYTIVQTIFYNTPACEDYSVFQDNRCEQQGTPPESDPADELGGSNNSSSGNRTAR